MAIECINDMTRLFRVGAVSLLLLETLRIRLLNQEVSRKLVRPQRKPSQLFLSTVSAFECETSGTVASRIAFQIYDALDGGGVTYHVPNNYDSTFHDDDDASFYIGW